MRFAKGITLLVDLVLAMLALVATSLFGGEAERTGAQYFAGTADPDELGPVPRKDAATVVMTEVPQHRIGAAASDRDWCLCDWQGSVASFTAHWYTGREYYAVYQDPAEKGCISSYPFEVDNIAWYLGNFSGSDRYVDVYPIIYSCDSSDPGCPKPGVVLWRGDSVSVYLPNGQADWVHLSVDFCVNGPYFAGVWCPTYVGTGIVTLYFDDGAFPRSCAIYNNWGSSWHDLRIDEGFNENLVLGSSGYTSPQNSCDTCPIMIAAGYDLWVTSRQGGLMPSGVFQSTPVPADFFGPGSDPFDGQVYWVGEPFTTTPPGVLGETDAIFRRLDTLAIPDPATGYERVDVELVALSLRNASPVTITYGGTAPEQWDVRACLSATPHDSSEFLFDGYCCVGGAWFDGGLAYYPKFIFTRQSDATQRTLDEPMTYEVSPWLGGQWSAYFHPPHDSAIVTSPGLVDVNQYLTTGTPDVTIGQSSRLLLTHALGDPWFPRPCDDMYCLANVQTTGHQYISRVEVGSIDNATGSNGYTDYTATQSTVMGAGYSYPIVVTGTNTISNDYCRVWVDWNQDFDFFDADEEIALTGSPGVGPYTDTITPPPGTPFGNYRMRVRLQRYIVVECGTSQNGEVEDYRIQIGVPQYCYTTGSCADPDGGNELYIEEVDISSINNTSGCEGYADFYGSDSALMTAGGSYDIDVVPGYTGDEADNVDCAVWVDWNKNLDFTDPGEREDLYYYSMPPYLAEYSGSIGPPPGTPEGDYRMRIRLIFNKTVDPCSGASNGEAEDYRITVTGCCADTMVGDVNCADDPGKPDIGDMQQLIDRLFINVDSAYCCIEEADVDASGQAHPPAVRMDVDIADMQLLIDHLFNDMKPLPPCP